MIDKIITFVILLIWIILIIGSLMAVINAKRADSKIKTIRQLIDAKLSRPVTLALQKPGGEEVVPYNPYVFKIVGNTLSSNFLHVIKTSEKIVSETNSTIVSLLDSPVGGLAQNRQSKITYVSPTSFAVQFSSPNSAGVMEADPPMVFRIVPPARRRSTRSRGRRR